MLEHVSVAESHYGVRFTLVTRKEFKSIDGCPWCKDGGRRGDGDRFRLFLGGHSSPRVWCRQCGGLEFLDGLNKKAFSDEELATLRERMKERKQEEQERQRLALINMMACTDHRRYHRHITEEAVAYWIGEGLSHESIQQYLVGYCESCPTAPFSASYTVPVVYEGQLFNIRHRLISPNGSGKYRPHMPNLPPMLFNADNLKRQSSLGLLVEGEKKSMVVTQHTGIPSVAIMGNTTFRKSWASKFDNWGQVVVATDPDTETTQKMISSEEKAVEIATAFSNRGLIAILPVKADDFFSKIGGTKNDFMQFVMEARPV